MYIDYVKELDRISFIYSEIYKWIFEVSPAFNKRVEAETTEFMNPKCAAESVEVKYSLAYEIAKAWLEQFIGFFEHLETYEGKDGMLKLRLYTELLFFLYRDIQQELFLYNTLYNKLLFEKKFEKVYEQVAQGRNITVIEFLEYIELHTKYKYLDNPRIASKPNFERIERAVDGAVVGNFIELLTTQKKWERKFSDFMLNDFSEAFIKIRSAIHSILDKMGIQIDEESKYCGWTLLRELKRICA